MYYAIIDSKIFNNHLLSILNTPFHIKKSINIDQEDVLINSHTHLLYL